MKIEITVPHVSIDPYISESDYTDVDVDIDVDGSLGPVLGALDWLTLKELNRELERHGVQVVRLDGKEEMHNGYHGTEICSSGEGGEWGDSPEAERMREEAEVEDREAAEDDSVIYLLCWAEADNEGAIVAISGKAAADKTLLEAERIRVEWQGKLLGMSGFRSYSRKHLNLLKRCKDAYRESLGIEINIELEDLEEGDESVFCLNTLPVIRDYR